MNLEQLRIDIINTSRRRKAVCDMIPENASRILEVGCGQGGILLRLQRDKGCTELHGVDMDVEAIKALRHFVDGAEVGNIERGDVYPEKYKGYFKYIILHDVVEHLFDPWFTMTKIREFLADDGVAIIATPNLHHWEIQHEIMSGKFTYGPGIWHSGHLRWYTPASLLNVLGIAGYAVQEYFFEMTGIADVKSLYSQKNRQVVQFPPVELQDRFPDKPVYTVQYPQDISAYYPIFFGFKLLAVCSKGELGWEPEPLTYNCAFLQELTKAMENTFDVFNPPPMLPIKQGVYPMEEYVD